jgi:hypothetical protein
MFLGKWIVPHFDNLALRGRRLYSLGIFVAIMILSVIGLSIWPVFAAAVVKYFIVVPSQKELQLQWSTQNEYDLSGFEVLCKQESQLDNDYHVIGTVAAQGGPQQGANYSFPVLYTALQPGVNYCFRLRDVNIEGKSEDIFDRCGYGINITPTPATPVTNTLRLDATAVLRNAHATATALFFDANATAVALGASSTITGTPTPITATNALTATTGLTGTNPLTSNLNLTSTFPVTPSINGTPTPVVINPQDAPAATATALAISATVQAANSGQITAPTATPVTNSPLPGPATPTTQTQSATLNNSVDAASLNTTATEQAIAQAPPPPPVEQTPVDPAHPADQQNANVGSANVGQQPANSLPSPLYIAVTETPTAATTAVAPTLTPFPNITPPQNNPQRLVDYLTTPAMQNLTLTLLCLTFVSASGLGILGLITSALYMRSRRGVIDLPRRRK